MTTQTTHPHRNNIRNLNRVWPVVILVVLTAVLVALTAFRESTLFESALLQFMIMGVGIVSSYIFGRNSARDAAADVIRPHARSAFRRVTGLYQSLYRLDSTIERMKGQGHNESLNIIQAVVHEQIAAGEDAIEDWRDIIPEEIAEIERRQQAEIRTRET